MKTKILILICLLFALAYAERVKAPEVPLDTKDPVEARLDALINQLAFCESSNDISAYVEDDGGSPSAGLLQFKKATMLHYWKKLINKDIEDHEAENIWKDAESQKQLAKQMIRSNPDNLRHWSVCSKRHNLISFMSP